MTIPLTFQAASQTFLHKYQINTNLIESAKFVFISYNEPYLNYFCQTATIPGITANPATMETPFSKLHFSQDKMTYDPLTVTFLVDEDLRVWEETYNWMRGLAFPHSHKEYQQQKIKGIYADFALLFSKNSDTSNLTIKFKNCFPISLGPINFSVTESAEKAMTCDATFQYDTYEVIR